MAYMSLSLTFLDLKCKGKGKPLHDGAPMNKSRPTSGL